MTKEECLGSTREHIDNVRKFLTQVLIDLLRRTEEHDKSKLTEPELSVFMEYTPKLANTIYGSDEYKRFLEEMKPALNHHYAYNDHHPEYFSGVTPFNRMNLLAIIEMLCDWKASTLRHKDGNLLESIEKNQKRFGYTDEMKGILINTARYLGLFTRKKQPY